jgi:IS5 family transposase
VATGEVVHIDATLIRANVSWDSLAARHVAAVDEVNALSELSRTGTVKRVSTTDPDATLACSDRRVQAQPSYKQHTAVDDRAGIVVDVTVTTGETNEGDMFAQQLQNVAAVTGRTIDTVTADAGYAYAKVYASAEREHVHAIVPPKAEPPPKSSVPLRRFKYDARHEIVRCPAGRILRRSTRAPHGWFYRAKVADCRRCHLRQACLPRPHGSRSVVISDGYDALLRARRHREDWSDHEYTLYQRHRWRIEGAHADAKMQHGLRRAVRRGLSNVAIQAYLTAAAMYLKRLAAAFLPVFRVIRNCLGMPLQLVGA